MTLRSIPAATRGHAGRRVSWGTAVPVVAAARAPGVAAGLVPLAAAAALGLVAAMAGAEPPADAAERPASPPAEGTSEAAPLAVATFAGGCFWCVEQAFDEVDGVTETTSGYTGGHVADPSYDQVTRGATGHVEAVRVRFDPEVVGYAQLLDVFWRNVDPTDAGGQFCDRGSSYRTAVFVHDGAQRALAETSKRRLEAREDFTVVTPIAEAGPFYPAEAYHQDYHRKNPARYRFYKWRCGRQARLEQLWGEQAP